MIKNAERPYASLPDYYTTLSNWYVLAGNFSNAKLYIDSALIAKDTVSSRLNTLFLLRAEQKASNEKIVAEQEKVRMERRLKNTQFYAGLILILLIVVFVAIVLYIQRKRRLMEAEINKQKLSKAAQELAVAQAQLLRFTKDISEKNKQIESLIAATPDNNEMIARLRETAILTANDWETFRAAFEKVHAGFIDRLRENIKDITPAEIRMLVLTKLKLSKKEMANTLGISPESLRVTWHRLKKKTIVDAHTNIEDLVSTI